MTGWERVQAVFSSERPDRPALYAWLMNDALLAYLAGEPITEANAPEATCRAYRQVVDFSRWVGGSPFGPDCCPRTELDDLGYTRRYERWTNWIVEHPYRDAIGYHRFIEAEIEQFRAWTPRHTEELHARFRRLEAMLDGATVLAGRVTMGTAPGPYCRDGLASFSYLMADRPGLLAEWVRARHEMNLRKITALADPKACAVEFLDADIAYKNGLMFSPQYLRKTGWFVRLAELVDAYHAAGLRAVFHSDGDLRPILKDLAATGIDGLNPIETAAGMSLSEVRALVGPHVVLVGGMDIHLLMRGPPDRIRATVRRHLDKAGPLGRIILGPSSEELDESIPLAHQLAFIEAVHEYCWE